MADPITNNAAIAPLISLLKAATRIGLPMREGVAEPEQLSVTELRILLALGGEGDMAGHEMAEFMAIQPMNISRALARMAEAGLVKAIDNSGNRRRKPYRLTSDGQARFEGLEARMRAVADFAFGGLSAEERALAGAPLGRGGQQLMTWDSAA